MRSIAQAAGTETVVTLGVLDRPITDPEELTPAEFSNLQVLEQLVTLRDSGYILIGNALKNIRDNRLYRATAPTFDSYLKARFDMSRASAYRYIEAALVNKQVEEVAEAAGVSNLVTQRESVLRPLVKVPDGQRCQEIKVIAKRAVVIAVKTAATLTTEAA